MRYDALVVGAGPNGLAAAITLARAGRSVLLREAADEPGGGLRSAALTLPGFVHDVCASVHGMAALSPVFATMPLAEHGLELVHADAPLAYPFPDGSVAMLERSLDRTAAALGVDGRAWRALFEPLCAHAIALAEDVLAPLRVPQHPFAMGRFAVHALRSASALARGAFRGDAARALFESTAAHALVPLDRSPSAAFGLVLTMAAHVVGWPFARGGSASLARALASYARALGVEIVTSAPVERIDDARSIAPLIFLDLTPAQWLRIAGDALPPRYQRALERFRYAGGVFKMDWALAAPIPWRSPECARAGTLHLAGTREEMLAAERRALAGEIPEHPFLLLSQPTLADPTRAPPGRHVAWAYTHVPLGSRVDMTSRIEAQVERFAPGFRDCILARSALAPADLERHDANLVGGDITGGAMELAQLFRRPTSVFHPYATPIRGVYLCSASTPPGSGVHGMCGYHAVRRAIG